jgi:glutathione S-transferase
VVCSAAIHLTLAQLLERARAVLEPARQTLAAQPFVSGDTLTLADVALYGQWAMLEAGSPDLLDQVSPVFVAHARRIEQARTAHR